MTLKKGIMHSNSLEGNDYNNPSSGIVKSIYSSIFFLALQAFRALLKFSGHNAHRLSCILNARHKYREQDPPPTYSRLDALIFRLDKRVQIENQLAGAIVIFRGPLGNIPVR